MIKSDILGQESPDPNVLVTAYTVGLTKNSTFSIYITNIDNDMDNFYIALVPNGQVLSKKNWIAFGTGINKGETISFNGLALSNNGSVIVKSDNGRCSFTITGLENN